MTICPVGAEWFHADGQMDQQADRQTDMMKLRVAFRNFVDVPKNGYLHFHLLIFNIVLKLRI